MNDEDPISVTLIDGRSGAGKTVLARRIADGESAQILSLESLYPGWGGLAAGSLAVVETLVRGEYRPYDWYAAEFSSRPVRLNAGQSLVIEGCGAVTLENLRAAQVWAGTGVKVRSIWIEAPEPLRRKRALERDGQTFAPHWDRWAAQEQAHFSRHEPWLLADRVIDVNENRRTQGEGTTRAVAM